MHSAEHIANILNTYGAWGVAAICVIGIVAVWTVKEKRILQKDEEIRAIRKEKEKDLAELNERIIKMTEKQTEMLTENKMVNQSIEKLLNRFMDAWHKPQL